MRKDTLHEFPIYMTTWNRNKLFLSGTGDAKRRSPTRDYLELEMRKDTLHEFPVHVGSLPLAQPEVSVEHVVLKDQTEPSPTHLGLKILSQYLCIMYQAGCFKSSYFITV